MYIPSQGNQYLSAIVEIFKEQLVLKGLNGSQLIPQVLLSVQPYTEDFTDISPVSENIFINVSQYCDTYFPMIINKSFIELS